MAVLLEVAGAQDKEKGCDTSNHDCILAAFRDEADYICVHRQVDPVDCNIPLSRPRLFYMGFRAEVVAENAKGSSKEAFASAFRALWDKTVAEAARSLPQHRLDAFLYGHATDLSLRDVPSVQRALAQTTGPHLPIARDDSDKNDQPKKKQRGGAQVQWPKLHLAILEENGASWIEFIFLGAVIFHGKTMPGALVMLSSKEMYYRRYCKNFLCFACFGHGDKQEKD